MENVRKSKINIEEIREFFVYGHKQLLISKTTMEDLDRHELPLVMTGVLSEERPVVTPVEITPETPLVQGNPSNVIVANESLKSGFDVTGPTPTIIQPETVVNDNIPLVNSGMSEREVPVITPVEITAETPLVQGDPNNVFVKASSAVTGFDVTENTPVMEQPVIENVKPEEMDVETAIAEQINEPELPKREVIGMDDLNLETPQTFNENLEVSIPTTEEPIAPQYTETDPYISANVEIEKIRSEFNDQIDKMLSDLQTLKQNTNLNLDNVSRSVEKARQTAQNDAKAIMDTVQSGINSLNEGSYQEIHVSR